MRVIPWLRGPAIAPAIGVLYLITMRVQAAEPPSIEFVAAALNSQLQAAAVDVEFTKTTSAFQSSDDFRYIRTPGTLYMSAEKDDKSGFCIFDRKRGIGKTLLVADGKKRGWIKKDTSGMPLNLAGWPDPVFSLLHIGYLVDVIGQGAVAPSMEQVDGHDCWRVDLQKDTGKMIMKFSVWLDPEIGFCPRRTESSWKDHKQVCLLTDYKDIGEGVWFPMNVRWECPDFGVLSVTEARVKSAKVVANVKNLSLNTGFPSGTKVEDEVLDASYTVE